MKAADAERLDAMVHEAVVVIIAKLLGTWHELPFVPQARKLIEGLAEEGFSIEATVKAGADE